MTTTVTLELVNDTLLVIRMNNLRRSDKILRVLGGVGSLAILLWVLAWDVPANALPLHNFLRHFILIALSVMPLLVIYSLLTRIKRTEIDFAKGEIRQFYAHPLFSRIRQFQLSDFSSVLSALSVSRFGIVTISVALTGRHRTLAIANFGSEGLFQSGHCYDQPEAQALRQQIAARLKFRNLGVI